MTIYERSSTPRLAPRIVLNNILGMSSSRMFRGVAGKPQRDTHKGVLSTLQGVAGNCNGTLSEASYMNNAPKEENRFKSVSEFMEYHTTTSTKTVSG